MYGLVGYLYVCMYVCMYAFFLDDSQSEDNDGPAGYRESQEGNWTHLPVV